MAQYIDKSALVAEIERRKASFKRDVEDGCYPTYLCALMDFEEFIETLEVKEVDLHKELDDYIERQKAWVKDDWVVEYNNGDSFNHIYDLEKIAKHFFELGIQQSKNKQQL